MRRASAVTLVLFILLALNTIIGPALGGPGAMRLANAETVGSQSMASPAGTAGCVTASLSGSFGYTFTGAGFLGPDGVPAPGGTKVDIVAVGVIVYDGQGSFAGNDMISSAGSVRPRSFTGTYTVNPDCTGTSTIDLATGAVHTFFVITDAGTEFRIIVTDPGAGLTGIARKQ